MIRWRDGIMFGCGILVGAVVMGTAIGGPSSLFQSRFKKLDIFASVLSYIENDYVEPISSSKLIQGAIQGMVKQLDPYTVFIPPKQYQEMKSETSGEYGGPGLELRQHGNKIIVEHPLPNSPASRAGIKPGDQLLKANKTAVSGRSLFDVRRLLRGRPGTRLVLVLRRKATKTLRTATVIREQIRTSSIRSKWVEKGYLYIHIKSFQDRTTRQMKEALLKYQRQGKLKGLVIDLRNNPGGLFDQSVRIADMFLDKGLIVTARGRNPKKIEREMAHQKGTIRKLRIVCLINRGSASASEILAGALQDHRRAVLLGTLSFGKGSVQTIIDLADGAGLKMTIARYYTPLNRLIHGTGIEPDVKVPAGNDDPQLKQALKLLKNPKLYKRRLGRGLPKKLRKKRP